MKTKTGNYRKLNEREREVYLAVTSILDITEENTEFTERLKLVLNGY